MKEKNRKIDEPWSDSQNWAIPQTSELNNYFKYVDGGFSLDFYNESQFVQNETILPLSSWNITLFGYANVFQIKHIPFMPDSLTGTVYVQNTPVQTFVFSTKGCSITNIGNPDTLAVTINAIHSNGYLEIFWNKDPIECHIVVSYEYKYGNSVENH